MKILLCALLMAFSVCFADMCESNNSSIVGTICNLKECQKDVKNSIDSLKNAQNKAISNDISIKIDESGSLSIFLKIIIGFSITVSGGSIIITYRNRKSIKKAQQEIEKDSKNQRDDFDKWFNDTKDNFENIYSKKSEMNDIKERLEMVKKNLEDIKNAVYKDVIEKNKHMEIVLEVFRNVTNSKYSPPWNKSDEKNPDNNGG